MFWIASNEGLIINGSSAHAGLRTRLSGWEDFEDDERQGFLRIAADDIDDIGTKGVVEAILKRIGSELPVYLSLDIDVIDPGLVGLEVSRMYGIANNDSVLAPELLKLAVGLVER